MRIRDVMHIGPFTIQDSDALGNAQAAMTRAHVRHLPVLGDGTLVGMLSERDILALRAHDPEAEWWKLAVRDAMRSPPATIGPDEPLAAAATRMGADRLGALAVIERGELIGVVTAGDVLSAEVPKPSPLATAAEAMTPWPVTVEPDAPLALAIARMTQRHVRHLPVIDARCTVVGMVSERDVRTAIGDPVQYLELRAHSPYRVRDVMSAPAIAVPFDRPLVEIARLFADRKLGAVPVMDRFGALIGIVSYVDVLRALAV